MKCSCGDPSCSFLHTLVWNALGGLLIGALLGYRAHAGADPVRNFASGVSRYSASVPA